LRRSSGKARNDRAARRTKSDHIHNLERLRVRISDVNEAAKRNPMSLDIARVETSLAKQWNRLVSDLKAAGIDDYEPRPVIEEEIPPMHWLQT